MTCIYNFRASSTSLFTVSASASNSIVSYTSELTILKNWSCICSAFLIYSIPSFIWPSLISSSPRTFKFGTRSIKFSSVPYISYSSSIVYFKTPIAYLVSSLSLCSSARNVRLYRKSNDLSCPSEERISIYFFTLLMALSKSYWLLYVIASSP